MNVAFFETRGTGETGWSPALQWHVRRASAWTGRTIASQRVFDVLQCLKVLRTIPGVDPDQIRILADGEMAAVAAYAALLDGNIKTLVLQNPPESQNLPSQPNGTGAATEMLNCLQITDLPQVAGLQFPHELVVVGKLPSTYDWAENLYRRLNKPQAFRVVEELSAWNID
jgi:hypothetical protein